MAEEKQITCIVCPLGCTVNVTAPGGVIQGVSGHECKRGEKYARDEFTWPLRVVFTTVAVENAILPVVPVRSNRPLPRELVMEAMQEIRKQTLKAPLEAGHVVIRNILATGADIVTTAPAKAATPSGSKLRTNAS